LNAQYEHFAGVCSTLRAGDRLVAVHVGMRSPQVLHWWFPAYDRELARYSPGMILLFRLAEAAHSAGIRTIDLGKGDEDYKQRVMTRGVVIREGAVEMPSLLSTMRRLRRGMETSSRRGGLAAALRLPLRLLRRIERAQRFR
jgi:CelD/BcsL family acetyltransferase involved in cellulose biosynthesis